MIRNAILHIMNEHPMLADLFDEPLAVDVGLRCTNLRTMNGKRPIFVESSASVFYFPYLHVRFVELPPASLAGTGLEMDRAVGVGVGVGIGAGAPETAEPIPDEPDLEIDEDFLRRIREV